MTTPATSKDIIEAFIGLIESHPCIYQYESQDQKDRTQIGLAWRDIMTSLEEAFARDDLIAVKLDSIKELKAKYHNLRSTYFKSKKSMEEPQAASDSVVSKTRWIWFDAMSFLESCPNPGIHGGGGGGGHFDSRMSPSDFGAASSSPLTMKLEGPTQPPKRFRTVHDDVSANDGFGNMMIGGVSDARVLRRIEELERIVGNYQQHVQHLQPKSVDAIFGEMLGKLLEEIPEEGKSELRIKLLDLVQSAKRTTPSQTVQARPNC